MNFLDFRVVVAISSGPLRSRDRPRAILPPPVCGDASECERETKKSYVQVYLFCDGLVPQASALSTVYSTRLINISDFPPPPARLARFRYTPIELCRLDPHTRSLKTFICSMAVFTLSVHSKGVLPSFQ